MLILKLASRNIWRNKRRTFITAVSIMFAVLLVIFSRAIQAGTWDRMIENVLRLEFGYAQIHKKGFWDEQSLDKSLAYTDSLQEQLLQNPEINGLIPRVEYFALVSYGNNTKAARVVGIDPSGEKRLSEIDKKIIAGSYFQNNEPAALIGKELAERLDLELGDSLVLISQGYHGANAAGLFPIAGIFDLRISELNKRFIYLPLEQAQSFFGMDGRVTNLILEVNRPKKVKAVVGNLHEELDTSKYEIMHWEEMMPELLEARAFDEAGTYVTMALLYLIIAFGIFGTIIMMIKERLYEFGVTLAVGMKRRQIALMVFLETILIGVLGCLLGMLAALPIAYYFKVNPIILSGEAAKAYEKFGMDPVMPATLEWPIFYSQAIIIFVIIFIMALYPIWTVLKLQPVEAMREG